MLRDGRLVATASTAELTPGHVITLMAGDRGAVQSRNGKQKLPLPAHNLQSSFTMSARKPYMALTSWSAQGKWWE